MSAERVRRAISVACVVIASAGLPALAAQTAAPPAVQAPKPAKAAPSARPAPAASSAQFDQLVADATAARTAEHWEDAVDLYAKAVKLRPDYAEGYWYQGTSLYQLDRFPECRDAFRRVIRLSPKNGAAFAFLGLCEFGNKNYDRALQNLLQGRDLGIGDKDLGQVARYHAAIVMTRLREYAMALQTLGEFTAEGNDNPTVIEAMGIATLRMAMLPNEVPPDRREMVLMAGRGSYMMAGRQTAAAAKAFEALVARYPDTPNVHYAYALFLLVEQPDKAIGEFKRELELQPNDPESLMQIAFAYLKAGDAEAALPWAKQAADAAPNVYAAHKALGEALVETGDVESGISALELAIKLAPDSPGSHFSLAKAYQRAGRTEDATREREEFKRLDRIVRVRTKGANSIGGMDVDKIEGTAPGSSQ